MRIGLLTTSFPRTPEDGAGRFVLEFARALIRARHQVEVLAPEDARLEPTLTEPDLCVSPVPYLRPRGLQRTFYGAGVPDNLARDPRAWLGPVPFTLSLLLRARAASSQWDAIVSHWALPCALVGARVARGRPHLAVLHSADVHALGLLPMRSRLATAIARGADGLWFVAHAHRERFLAWLPQGERASARSRSWVSAMGIEPPDARGLLPSAREAARARLGLDRFSVLALGRLVPIKGLDIALRACAGRDVTLLVAGAGPKADHLRELARRLGVDARFFGHVAGDTKEALLTAADALVAPSRVLAGGRSEGVPVALLEAMARGLPIVASAVGGIVELLPADGSAGLLVPPDRPEALRAALDHVQSQHAWRSCAVVSARSIAQRHAWDHVIVRALSTLEWHKPLADFVPTP